MRHPITHPMLEPSVATTLVELLRSNAEKFGDKQAFCFIRDEAGEELTIGYRQLDERAKAIAGQLQALVASGERALLLYPPGLDFIAAFFGCLYAGVVAVPAALPARSRATSSVEAIVNASRPALILSTAEHCSRALQSYAHLPSLVARPWLATDSVAINRQHAWSDPHVDPRQAAFLQYTSGSTSSPKGVVLTHENVLCNAALIQQAFGNTPESRGVFWLPQYHDMGLIGGIVQPIYCGGSSTLLAPAAFLQRPALWLETISRTHATVSGGPDFAYNLCVRKVPPAERAKLDLSSWNVAFTGAERVRAETIERFVETFAGCGFRRESFFPCYGLAEATLMASGGPCHAAPTIVHIDADALGHHTVQDVPRGGAGSLTLVGCGQCLPGQTIAIVNPDTSQQCRTGEVGEIWLEGPCVASGYYGAVEATEAAFGGYIEPTRQGPFLRTGDLGFLRDGQLFVAGRLKDVIIIRGRNYYPEDIEYSVAHAHASFRAGYCAAFAIDVMDHERLVVVQEIEPRWRDLDDAESALSAIRGTIAAEHDLSVHAVVLAKAGEIPKTSSGKTQRSACRQKFLDGQLKVIAQWKANGETTDDETFHDTFAPDPRTVTVREAEAWLTDRIATRLGMPVAQVSASTPFLEFGMGSLDAVEIAAELERWLGRRMSPTAIYNYPSIAALAHWLAHPPCHDAPADRPHSAGIAIEVLHPTKLVEDIRNMSEEDINAFILQEMANSKQAST